jgi:hypothetical protein
MITDPRTRVVSCRRNEQQQGFVNNAVTSVKFLLTSTVRTFLMNLATRTQVNLQVNGRVMNKSCCSDMTGEVVLSDFLKAESLLMVRPWIVEFLKKRVLGDREDMVKVRFRYRYAFNDYLLEILPIGATHYAIKLLFVYPIDTLFTRMTTATGEQDEEQSVVECAESIYNKDGYKGFYRGFPAALLYYTINRLSFVLFFDLFKNLLVRDPRYIPEWKHVVIHNHASLLADTLSYPFETIRANMMADTGRDQQKYTDVLDCAKKIVQQRGPVGLFKGFSILLLRHSWKWYSQMYAYTY